MAIRFGRKTPWTWEKEIFREDWFIKTMKPRKGRIMFPSTHDISVYNIDHSISFIKRHLERGNSFLLVTKPQLDCVKQICAKLNRYSDKIMFRFSIGSSIESVLRYWEPNASSYEERCSCIKFAYSNGFQTSLSCEPMLDKHPDIIIKELEEFITDSIWLGKPNFLLRRLKINGQLDVTASKKAKDLIESLNDEFIYNLYENYKDNPKVKWKESLKKVLKLEIPVIAGFEPETHC